MFAFQNNLERLNRLIGRGRYEAAIKLLQDELKRDPRNDHFRKLLGGLMPKVGKAREGLKILYELAQEYRAKGFITKSLAVLRKMQREFPTQHLVIEQKITELVQLRDTKSGLSSISEEDMPEDKQASKKDPNQDKGGITLNEGEELEFEIHPRKAHTRGAFNSKPSQPPAEIAISPATPDVVESPLFENFSKADLDVLLQSLQLIQSEPGQILVSEGQPGDSLMVLVSGQLRVYVRNDRGVNNQVRVLNEGDFFGEVALISGKPRTATITCVTPCELLVLSKKTLVKLSEDYPEIPRIMTDYYMKRVNSPKERAARS